MIAHTKPSYRAHTLKRLWGPFAVALLCVWPRICVAAQGGTGPSDSSLARGRPPGRAHKIGPLPNKPIVVAPWAPGADAEKVAEGVQLFGRQQVEAALLAIEGVNTPAAWLLRARAALQRRQYDVAQAALDRISSQAIMPLVHVERGALALGVGHPERAVEFLQPLIKTRGATARAAALLLAEAQSAAAPQRLILCLPDLLALFSSTSAFDSESRSQLRGWAALAHERLHDDPGALNMRLARYLQEPTAPSTPQQPPAGAVVPAAAALARIEVLVAAHASTRARGMLAQFDAQHSPATLTAEERCRKHFAQGLVARKLHHYSEAAEHLSFVRARCQDADLARRAAFIEAKVVTITDGLAALPLIEQFVSAYPDHSMTDDVLFWAGDMHQRRGQKALAESAYERILRLPVLDDQCEEAGWRLAWLAYADNHLLLARRRLTAALAGRCRLSTDSIARAHYWLGRIDETSGQSAQARSAYRRAWAARPMGFYGQAAVVRLLPLLTPLQRRTQIKELRAPAAAPNEALCPHSLATQPEWDFGLQFLQAGLTSDAAARFAELKIGAAPPRRDHAAKPGLRSCGPDQAALLLAKLQLLAGDDARALQTLLGHLERYLLAPGEWGAGSVWRAAYPQAFRADLSAAERDAQVPPWLLQALAREESQFDTTAVSWAEAYGLTQLTFGAAQTAGRRLDPKKVPTQIAELFDPAFNGRLGGALLGQLGQRYQQFWPLALAGYNGGQKLGDSIWRQFAGQDFARMAEEISVKETRGYVQRVMQTYGIYSWLYAQALPGEKLPGTVPLRVSKKP